MKRFTPLGERVVVKPSEGEQTIEGGLVLPDTAIEKPLIGEVVAVGPGRIGEDGNRIPMELPVGDRVIYAKFSGTEYKVGNDEFLIIRESDILGDWDSSISVADSMSFWRTTRIESVAFLIGGAAATIVGRYRSHCRECRDCCSHGCKRRR